MFAAGVPGAALIAVPGELHEKVRELVDGCTDFPDHGGAFELVQHAALKHFVNSAVQRTPCRRHPGSDRLAIRAVLDEGLDAAYWPSLRTRREAMFRRLLPTSRTSLILPSIAAQEPELGHGFKSLSGLQAIVYPAGHASRCVWHDPRIDSGTAHHLHPRPRAVQAAELRTSILPDG